MAAVRGLSHPVPQQLKMAPVRGANSPGASTVEKMVPARGANSPSASNDEMVPGGGAIFSDASNP